MREEIKDTCKNCAIMLEHGDCPKKNFGTKVCGQREGPNEVIHICDGCGKRVLVKSIDEAGSHKPMPNGWYALFFLDGLGKIEDGMEQDPLSVCSRECADKITVKLLEISFREEGQDHDGIN